MSLKGKAAAIGIGELKPIKEPPDLTALGLMAKVAAEAIADAGLEKRDIDGFLVGVPFADPGMIYPASAAEVLGLNLRMLNQVDIGGASPAGMIWRAAAAIDAGMCNAVLCIVADLNKTGDQTPAGDLGAARVRGAVRKYRRELRLRDDRASPYA